MSGPFGASQWMYNSATGFYPFSIDQSLRFNDGDSAHLYRTTSGTPSSTTSTVFSCWFKRSTLGTFQAIWESATTAPNVAGIVYFTTDDKLVAYLDKTAAGSDELSNTTTAVFRDVSAWYHLVVVYNTADGTAANKIKIYINGVQQAVTTSTTGSAVTTQRLLADGVVQTISKYFNGTGYMDGYLAEFHVVDGVAGIDYDDFGETKDGVWVAKQYSGGHGDNGFYLTFQGTGTATTSDGTTAQTNIGDDQSGNGNNFAVSGLVASDVMTGESPTNNFSTLNILSKDDTSVVYSEGNLQAINTTSTSRRAYSTIAVKAGKWYLEYYVNAIGSSTTSAFGVQQATDVWADGLRAYRANGDYFNGSGWASYGATFTTGDIISFAVDYDSDTIEFFKNNVSQGQKTSVGFDTSYDYVALINLVSSFKATANFGQDSSFAGNKTAQGNGAAHEDFFYAPPSGYKGLNLGNFDEPTIINGSEYFNTVLYTGNGSSRSITGVGFSPDWIWFKARSGAIAHLFYDSVRGATKYLQSNSTSAEGTESNSQTSFDSDGFSLGTDSTTGVNQNSTTYVAWNWKAGGTAVNNTDGSITSQVSANTEAGFSIATYTGAGPAGTIGHGLSSAPELIIVKCRSNAISAPAWPVWHKDLASTAHYLDLQTTAAVTSAGAALWNNTAPTSSVFSVGTTSSCNSSGFTYVSYLFHSVEGYSKVGSYVGNGNTDGTFVYTGFRPAFTIIKRVDATQKWGIQDAVREPSNEVVKYLEANGSYAEVDNYLNMDYLSNGFKLRRNEAATNASGGTYIYIAFAETPFKYSNAR